MRSLALSVLILSFSITCLAQIQNRPAVNQKETTSGSIILSAEAAQMSQRAEMRENEMSRLQQMASRNTAAAIGLDYDVKYYRLNLRINPDSSVKYVKGSMTNHFKTLTAGFNLLKYDFAAALTCDSVYYHGGKLLPANIVENADVLEITLPVTLGNNVLDSVTVFYKGIPPTVPGFSNGTGFVKSTHNAGTKNYIYTLSEPYSAYTWWPCKSMITADKADTLEVYLNTPNTFRSASNGVRVSETTIGANTYTFWRHLYPISAYQVCLGVANYDQYPLVPASVNINGTMMDYYNLIFPETNTAISQGQLDKTKTMLTTFSSKFGDYPFKKEKYGNYTFGFGGGMEHNTFSGMNANTYNSASAWDVNAHELGHQWWGAAVTCGTWRDIWVNESFATYSEIVCAEFAPSVCSGWTGLSWRKRIHDTAMQASRQTQSIYVSDTSTILTIFTPAVYIYERGGMVISMLRTMMGDTKFFQALKNYQSDPLLQYGTAKTDDVRRHMQGAVGIDLVPFFNQWIYNTGFANYNSAKWNFVKDSIVFQLPQTVTSSALTHFDMPIVLRIQGALAANDTTVIIYDQGGTMFAVNNGVFTQSNAGNNKIQFVLSFVPTTVTFDPDYLTMANGTVAKNAAVTLATNILNFSGQKIPEGVKLNWTIEKSFDYSNFQVERSADGIHFTKIATLNSADYGNATLFNYTDAGSFSGKSFYRVKVVEKDGSIIYTKTIVISSEELESAYTISPNPATEFIIIKSKDANTVADIRIINAEGKEVKKWAKQNFGSNNSLRISVSELPAGNYFAEINDQHNKQTKKFIIVR